MAPTKNSNSNEAEKIVELKTTSRKMSRRYSSDEVADIIRLGLLNEAGETEDTVDYEELVSIGTDLGVSPQAIDRSILLLEQQQDSRSQDKQLWMKFRAHCIIFLSVSAVALLINLLAGLQEFWSGYIVVAMGLFLLGHYAGLRFAPEFLQRAVERTSELARNSATAYVNEDANVSFKIDGPSGFMESEGLVYLEDDHLKIEFQTYDSVLGLFRSNLKEAAIALADIRFIKLNQKFWSSELVILGRNMKVFRHLPSGGAGKLVLKLNRDAQQAALTLVLSVSERLDSN
ncbi:MAG: hypothetical protein ACI95C_001429 [Pseudohongiellaceae bacterium]|jgi:hypothetical protein